MVCVLIGAGCQTFQPQPIGSARFEERLETTERGGLRVSVTVPSRDEARRIFGVELYGEQIQPVWVRIENRTEDPYWLMLHGLDPKHFSAREAAYESHTLLCPRTNRRTDDHFERLAIIPAVPPQGETSGFAFT